MEVKKTWQGVRRDTIRQRRVAVKDESASVIKFLKKKSEVNKMVHAGTHGQHCVRRGTMLRRTCNQHACPRAKHRVKVCRDFALNGRFKRRR